jgi:hypothetical protein
LLEKKPINGEALLLPTAIKMCEIIHGENYGQALKAILISNNTMMQQTQSMSEDIKKQLLTWNKCRPKFAF